LRERGDYRLDLIWFLRLAELTARSLREESVRKKPQSGEMFIDYGDTQRLKSKRALVYKHFVPGGTFSDRLRRSLDYAALNENIRKDCMAE